MYDKRIVRRSAFGVENFFRRNGIKCESSEAIDGFGWEHDGALGVDQVVCCRTEGMECDWGGDDGKIGVGGKGDSEGITMGKLGGEWVL